MRVQTASVLLGMVALVTGCSGAYMEGVDGGAGDADPGDAAAMDASEHGDAAAADGGTPGPRTVRVYVGRPDGDLVVHAIGADGALAETSRTRTGHFPSFAALAPDGRSMYVVQEGSAQVVALAVEPGSGRTTVRNAQPSGGDAPTHVSLDREGRFALVANFGAGTVRVFPIAGDGSLGAPVDTESPGANAHAIQVDRSNRWVLVPCRDADRVVIYGLDADTGALTLNATHRTASGAGPRHLAFDADGDRAYLVNEYGSSVDVLAFDPTAGTLDHLQTLSTLPDGFSGSNTGSEILVHPSGRFVYASNRGHDSIAAFEIGGDGTLSARGHALLMARTPRSMAITPDGARLYAGALEGGVVVRFAIGGDGALSREGTTPSSSDPYFVGAFAIPD